MSLGQNSSKIPEFFLIFSIFLGQMIHLKWSIAKVTIIVEILKLYKYSSIKPKSRCEIPFKKTFIWKYHKCNHPKLKNQLSEIFIIHFEVGIPMGNLLTKSFNVCQTSAEIMHKTATCHAADFFKKNKRQVCAWFEYWQFLLPLKLWPWN